MPKKSHQHKKKRQSSAERKAERLKKAQLQEHDHLDREIKYGQCTIKKHEKNWKNMLIKIHLPFMKEELIRSWQQYEKAIDCRDFTISLRMDDLHFAQRQRDMAFRNSIRNIDTLIDIYQDKLLDLKAQFEMDVGELQEHLKNEFSFENSKVEADVQMFKTMLYGYEMIRKTFIRHYRTDFFAKIDAQREAAIEELNIFSERLKGKYSGILKEAVDVINDYKFNTKEKKEEYKILQETSEATQKDNKEGLEKIKKLSNRINRLRLKFRHIQADKNAIKANVKFEVDYLREIYREIKEVCEKTNQKEEKNMQRLVTSSNKRMQKLEKLEKKGENLLTVIQACRKLETQFEKIGVKWDQSGTHTSFLQVDSQTDFDNFQDISDFWVKIAEADRSRIQLLSEREALLKENETMIQYMQIKYCGCLDSHGRVVSECPSKVANGVDGKLAMRNYEKMNGGSMEFKRD